MVGITNVEKLKAEINIESVNYSIEQETALVTFVVRVSYFQWEAFKAFAMEINVQEEQIKKIEGLLNEKRDKLNQSFSKIKNKISSLLRFSDRVEVDLSAISKMLLEAVK